MNEHVLVADIGGTFVRFALATPDAGLVEPRRYAAADFTSGPAAVARYLAEVKPSVVGAVLAVAGPVVDGVGRLTNRALEFSAPELEATLPLPRVMVINDFAAISAAVPFLAGASLRSIGAAAPRLAVKAVIGPGTGLGMGILVPLETSWRVVPSEGGHGDFAATDALEAELASVLRMRRDARRGHVSWETVLSGPGLVNLYRAVCEVWGCEPAYDTAAEISARGIAADDPVCHQTLETFCQVLGTAAGDLALTVCAEGGVYIAGGIVTHLIDFLAASHFRRRFEERGAMSDYVKRIATIAILDPDVGLLGAACTFRGEWTAGGFQLPFGQPSFGESRVSR